MPVLILLMSLFIFSCGKANDSALRGEGPFIARGENKAFFTLEYSHDSSLLRQKLLNTVVQSALKEPLLRDSDSLIFRDEFVISNISQDILLQDEVFYKENEKWMSKIIVSYQDHLEIYFVPDGILLSRLIEVLNLIPEKDREFRWINPHLLTTQKGNTFYLLSFNHEDLIANDKNFYKMDYEWGSDYMDKELFVEKNQKLEIDIRYDYYAQPGVPQSFKGSNQLRCTKELREEGTFCGQHYYKRLVNGGSFEKAEMNDLNKLGFEINLSHRKFTPSQVNAFMVSNGFFKIIINPADYVDQSSYRIAFNSFTPQNFIKSVVNFELTPGCRPVHTSPLEEFGAKSNFKISIKVIGRGERLRTIIF